MYFLEVYFKQGLFQTDKASGGSNALLKSDLFEKKIFFLDLNQKSPKQLPVRGDSTSKCPSG